LDRAACRVGATRHRGDTLPGTPGRAVPARRASRSHRGGARHGCVGTADHLAGAGARIAIGVGARPHGAREQLPVLLRDRGCRGRWRDRRPGNPLRLLPLPDRRDGAHRRHPRRPRAADPVPWQPRRPPPRQALSAARIHGRSRGHSSLRFRTVPTMKIARRSLLAAAITLASALAAPVVAQAKTELVIGATAGPYADQVKIGIKPLLEKKGYKVRVVEFNDYVQPNFALAQGALDANAFQHVIYLRKFARDNRLELSEVIKVPTAPIAVYSKKHESLDAVSQGATVALPNDPTNAARALVMLQDFGWIRLKADFDPVTASER